MLEYLLVPTSLLQSQVGHIFTSLRHLRMPQVEFIMPRDASDLMQRQIAQGSDGIDEVIKSLSRVDSEEAKAWSIQDEIKVKLITQ